MSRVLPQSVTSLSDDGVAVASDVFTHVSRCIARPRTFAYGYRILVVSSDGKLSRQCRGALLGAMFRVEAARSYDKAQTEMERFDPHLIIIDTALPGMQGYELLNQLKGDDDLYRLPVLLLTHATPERQLWDWGTGKDAISGYLVKPVDPVKLVRLATYLLASSAYPSRLKFAAMDGREIRYDEAVDLLGERLPFLGSKRTHVPDEEAMKAAILDYFQSRESESMSPEERTEHPAKQKPESGLLRWWEVLVGILLLPIPNPICLVAWLARLIRRRGSGSKGRGE